MPDTTPGRPLLHMPRLASALARVLSDRVANRRAPDFIVGAASGEGAYLLRWYLTPWRGWQRTLRERAEAAPTWWHRTAACVAGWLPNVYLHLFLRDDDDRALHDHPSWAASFILRDGYIEHTIADGGIHHRTRWNAGALRFLPTRHTHRIELHRRIVRNGDGTVARREPVPTLTLFVFGPTVREWGFHCPQRGWVPWQEFTAAGQPGEVGRGCE